MIPLLIAILGLAGLICEIVAVRWLLRLSRSPSAPRDLKVLWSVALIIGSLLGLSQFSVDFIAAYPLSEKEGTGTVLGVPFLAIYFDSAGLDYVGPLTYISVFGNAMFWFLVPHGGLAILLLSRRMFHRDYSASFAHRNPV